MKIVRKLLLVFIVAIAGVFSISASMPIEDSNVTTIEDSGFSQYVETVSGNSSMYSEENVSEIQVGGSSEEISERVFPEGSFLGNMRDWVEELPDSLQLSGIIIFSAVPFLESYTGAMLGIFMGLPLFAAVSAAVIGNMLSLTLVVYGAHGIRSFIISKKKPKELSNSAKKRREKSKKIFDKFGVPGVSLLGPFAFPSQFTAPLMVSFGANRHLVMLWMFISVIAWGLGFALLGTLFINTVSL